MRAHVFQIMLSDNLPRYILSQWFCQLTSDCNETRPLPYICYHMVLGQRGDPETQSFESLDMSDKMFAKEKSKEPFSGLN